jgi:hypothetical protein
VFWIIVACTEGISVGGVAIASDWPSISFPIAEVKSGVVVVDFDRKWGISGEGL